MPAVMSALAPPASTCRCQYMTLYAHVGLNLAAVASHLQSAALGLAIAGALALGYANIFVTAPSPENLRTLFEFVFKARNCTSGSTPSQAQPRPQF